jgi:hypothetical protein
VAKLLTVLPDIPETAELLAAIRRDKDGICGISSAFWHR